jgi:hypothetical protein
MNTIQPTQKDITAQLEEAIASLNPVKGGTIIIPDGAWSVSRPIRISGMRSINIIGETLNTRLEINCADSGFIFEGCAYSSLSSLRIAPLVPHFGYAVIIKGCFVFKVDRLYLRGYNPIDYSELPNKGAIVCKGLYLNGASNQITDSELRVGDNCLVVDGSTADPNTPYAGFVLDKVTCHPSEAYPAAIPLLIQNMGGGSLINVACLGGSRTEFRNVGSNSSILNSTFTDAAIATLFDPNTRNFNVCSTWFGGNAGGLDLRGSSNTFVSCNFRGVTASPVRLAGTQNNIQASNFVVKGSADKPCLAIDPTASNCIVRGNIMQRQGFGTAKAIAGQLSSSGVFDGNLIY